MGNALNKLIKGGCPKQSEEKGKCPKQTDRRKKNVICKRKQRMWSTTRNT